MVESADGKFKLKFGGRINIDFTEVSSDDESLEGGSEFRRARVFASGTVYDRFEFKLNYDFSGGDAVAKDVYIGLLDLPYVGGLRVGHFKEPFGLEEQTSGKYITFLERSLNNEAFNPVRNMGLMLHRSLAEDRVSWAAGVFQDSDDAGTSVGNEWNVTGRISGLPIWKDEGRQMVHVGLSASHRNPVDGSVRFRSRPEVHLTPRFVDTSNFISDGVDLISLELATVQGPFWAQTEWMQARANTPGSAANMTGYNVQVGYYLTGEHRRYKDAAFDRQKPKRPFLEEGGPGAWEIAARYSTLDLTDSGIDGGELDNLTLGINWYPNSATRLMLNWVNADTQDGSDADFFMLRFHVDF